MSDTITGCAGADRPLRSFDRSYRLSALSAALLLHGRDIALTDPVRAERVTALSDVLHCAAGGDYEGAVLALQEAREIRRRERRVRSMVRP